MSGSVQLQSISAASGDKYTAMLVTGILNDDQAAVNAAQDVIKARSGLVNSSQYTAAIDNIESGLNAALQRDSGKIRIV